MKKFLPWAFVCLSVMAHATVTITASLKDMTGTAVTTGMTARLTLKGCSTNLPRVIGTGIVPAVDQDFTPDTVTGVVTMTVYKNADITCGTTTGGTSYDFSILRFGTVVKRANYIFSVSADISSMSPTTSQPVVPAPTGDSTYLRLDGGNLPFLGPFNSCTMNGMYVVGSSCYATYAAARSAAGSGTVFLPNTASSSETVTDGNNSVLDLRRNAISSSHFYNCVYPMTNSPGGGDCVYEANGAGDLYLSHNTHVSPATTTAATLSIGANASVLVGSTALFGKGPGSYPLLVGRGSANYETIAGADWSVVDGTHLSITCTKTHSGTTDIEQLGVTELDAGIALRIFSHNPASLGGHAWPIPVIGGGGNILAVIPGNMSDSWPYNAIAFSVPLTGVTAGAGERNVATAPNDLPLRNADASHSTKIEGSGGSVQMYFPDGMNKFVSRLVSETTGGTPASSGAISLLRGDAICWRNEASSSDVCVNKDSSDNLNLGSTNATVSTTGFGTFLGGLKVGASGSTIADTRNLVQAVYNHSGTVQLTSHMVKDTCTLGTDCAVTLAGSAVFTGSGSYDCSVRDATTAANAVTVAKGSGTAVTFTGTGTDVVSYICIGN